MYLIRIHSCEETFSDRYLWFVPINVTIFIKGRTRKLVVEKINFIQIYFPYFMYVNIFTKIEKDTRLFGRKPFN